MAEKLFKMIDEAGRERTDLEQAFHSFRGAKTKEDIKKAQKSFATRKALERSIRKREADIASKSQSIPDNILPKEHRAGADGRALWKSFFVTERWQDAILEIDKILANKSIPLNAKQRFSLNLAKQRSLNAIRVGEEAERIAAEERGRKIEGLIGVEPSPLRPRPAGALIPETQKRRTTQPRPDIKFTGMGLFG